MLSMHWNIIDDAVVVAFNRIFCFVHFQFFFYFHFAIRCVATFSSEVHDHALAVANNTLPPLCATLHLTGNMFGGMKWNEWMSQLAYDARADDKI